MTGRYRFAVATAAWILASHAPALAHDPGLGRCLAMPAKDARLACYDEIARAEQDAGATQSAPVAAAPSRLPPAGAAAATLPAAPAPNPRAEFGFGPAEREERRVTDQRQLDDIVVRVTSAREVGAGYWEFAMEDGSLWRLTEMRASFRAPRPNDEVRLARASLGSYLLVFRSQPAMRIRRIQ